MPHVWSSPATIDRSLRAMTEMLTVSLTPSLVAITLTRSEEHTSELQSQSNLVCRLLLEITKLLDRRDQMPTLRGKRSVQWLDLAPLFVGPPVDDAEPLSFASHSF